MFAGDDFLSSPSLVDGVTNRTRDGVEHKSSDLLILHSPQGNSFYHMIRYEMLEDSPRM